MLIRAALQMRRKSAASQRHALRQRDKIPNLELSLINMEGRTFFN